MKRTAFHFALLSLAALTGGVLAVPADHHQGGPTRHGSAADAGLRVVMNPATGQVLSDPSGAAFGRRTGSDEVWVRPDSRGLESFELPSGARGVWLDDWADHALKVERDEDGALRVVCSRGDDHGGVG